jgi:DNA-binding response OmpR family regulator
MENGSLQAFTPRHARLNGGQRCFWRLEMSTYFPTVPVKAIRLEAHLLSSEELPPVVLVVDDEPLITETLAAILSNTGLAVITAGDGVEALETALVIPPEILITDLLMPGMNGLDLIVEIKRAVPDCKVIVSSGHATGYDLMNRMKSLGWNFVVLIKPVHPADLLTHVFELLNRSGLKAPQPSYSECGSAGIATHSEFRRRKGRGSPLA